MKFLKYVLLTFIILKVSFFPIQILSNKNVSNNANLNNMHAKTSLFESSSLFYKSTINLNSKLNVKNKATNDIDQLDDDFKFEQWVKFFRFINYSNPSLQGGEKKQEKPKAFYENPEYFEQFKRLTNPMDIQNKEDGLYKYPHTKNHFLALVTKSEITFHTSKEKIFISNFDTLKIDNIEPVSEDKGFLGGISNVGSFNEGECFKITTNKSGKYTWILCTDEEGEKLN